MNLRSQKQLAAKILKCGTTRVRVNDDKDVEEAITREDIRELVKKGLIWKVQKRGQCKTHAKKRLLQKKKGRKKGFGSKKGKAGARASKKGRWMKNIRAVRSALRKLKESGMIDNTIYRKMYLMAKGGSFKSKRNLILYLKDREFLKPADKTAKKSVKKATKSLAKRPAKKSMKATPIKKPATKSPAKKAVKKIPIKKISKTKVKKSSAHHK